MWIFGITKRTINTWKATNTSALNAKKKRGVDIVYGYPTDETFKSVYEGKLVLGGCVRNVDIRNPEYRCKK